MGYKLTAFVYNELIYFERLKMISIHLQNVDEAKCARALELVRAAIPSKTGYLQSRWELRGNVLVNDAEYANRYLHRILTALRKGSLDGVLAGGK